MFAGTNIVLIPDRDRAGEEDSEFSARVTITIEVKGDSKKESNETFYLDLFGNSNNSLFTKNHGLGTVLNDD